MHGKIWPPKIHTRRKTHDVFDWILRFNFIADDNNNLSASAYNKSLSACQSIPTVMVDISSIPAIDALHIRFPDIMVAINSIRRTIAVHIPWSLCSIFIGKYFQINLLRPPNCVTHANVSMSHSYMQWFLIKLNSHNLILSTVNIHFMIISSLCAIPIPITRQRIWMRFHKLVESVQVHFLCRFSFIWCKLILPIVYDDEMIEDKAFD